MKLSNEKGFTAVEIVLLLALVALVGFVGYRAYQARQRPQPITTTTPSPTPSPAVKSGVSGLVYNTYSCGNVPEHGSCTNQPSPYQAAIQVQDNLGKPVTIFTSAADGSFRVDLGPGTYILIPQSYNSGSTSAPSQSATVVSGSYTHATINYRTATP